MRSRLSADELARLVDEVRSGRAKPEECAAGHPAAEELLPLLVISALILPAPPVEPRPEFRARSRAELVARISHSNTVTRSRLQRLWSTIQSSWEWPTPLTVRRLISMPALVIAIIIALLTAGSGGAVYASQSALPGDVLYGVKTTTEGVQLVLASSEEARAQVHADLAAKRLAEIEYANQAGRPGAAAYAAEALTQEIGQATDQLARAAAKGADVTDVAAQLSANLMHQKQVLDDVSTRVPEAARPAIDRAREAAVKGLTIASSRHSAGTTPEAEQDAEDQVLPALGTPQFSSAASTSSTVEIVTPTVGVSTAVPTEMADLRESAEGLATDTAVPGQSYQGLVAKLDAAQAALDRGQPQVALNVLNGFLGQLNALRRSGHISEENYDQIYAQFASIVAELGGTPGPQATPHVRAGDDDAVAKATEVPDEEATPTPTKQVDKGASPKDKSTPPGQRERNDSNSRRHSPSSSPLQASGGAGHEPYSRPSPRVEGNASPNLGSGR